MSSGILFFPVASTTLPEGKSNPLQALSHTELHRPRQRCGSRAATEGPSGHGSTTPHTHSLSSFQLGWAVPHLLASCHITIHSDWNCLYVCFKVTLLFWAVCYRERPRWGNAFTVFSRKDQHKECTEFPCCSLSIPECPFCTSLTKSSHKLPSWLPAFPYI